MIKVNAPPMRIYAMPQLSNPAETLESGFLTPRCGHVCVCCYEFYGCANSLQETSLEAHVRHFHSEQAGFCGFSILSG